MAKRSIGCKIILFGTTTFVLFFVFARPLIAHSIAARRQNVKFVYPLLMYGYRPAVEEQEKGILQRKPLLLYLPGFDGTFLSPFLQFPELHTTLDVCCMTIDTKDRSTVEELSSKVVQYLFRVRSANPARAIYLAGESFGGILACHVANSLTIEDFHSSAAKIELSGLILINPATCYYRSALAREGSKIASLPSWMYIFGLYKLVQLLADNYSFEQLLMILSGKGLPSVIDNETREAYMGRVACSLPFIIPYIDQQTFRWRLSEWLGKGSSYLMERKNDTLRQLRHMRTLIIVAEMDKTLPSMEEAKRLKELWPDSLVHVVLGAGHASTCGSRIDLTALLRLRFPELIGITVTYSDARTTMKNTAIKGEGALFGIERRYDGKSIGLNPVHYWSEKFYRKYIL